MGDRDQIERLVTELYECWYSSLVSYATRRTGNLELAEEFVQETFLALCRELLCGIEIRSPKGWTLTVVRHQVGKWLRSRNEWGRDLPLDDAPDTALSSPDAPEVAATGSIELDELWKLCSQLSPREEEVVLLRMEGMKYAEIASHLRIGVPTVKTLIARAIRKLQGATGARDGSTGITSNVETRRRSY